MILFSCGAQINQGSIIENGQIIGTVEVGDNCAFICTRIDGKSVTMYPVNLEQQFKKSDVKIQFNFAISRAAQPTNCKVDRVVSVSNVSIVK